MGEMAVLSRRLAGGLLVLVLLVAPPAQALLLDGEPLEHSVDDLQSEIGVLRAVGEGVLLTLAACEDEPHCISGLAEREVLRVLREIEERIAMLEDAEDPGPAYIPVLRGYREVRDLFSRSREQFASVQEGVNVEALEGRWSDHFQADDMLDGSADVDFLHEHVSMDRFEDIDRPLPIH